MAGTRKLFRTNFTQEEVSTTEVVNLFHKKLSRMDHQDKMDVWIVRI